MCKVAWEGVSRSKLSPEPDDSKNGGTLPRQVYVAKDVPQNGCWPLHQKKGCRWVVHTLPFIGLNVNGGSTGVNESTWNQSLE